MGFFDVGVDQNQNGIFAFGGFAEQRINGRVGGLRRVSFAPSKKHGWFEMSWFSCASSGTMLSGLSQFKPVLPWTRIFSVASHSTPQVKPNPPLGLVSAQRRFRSSDQRAAFFRRAGRCRAFRCNERSRRRARFGGWRNQDTRRLRAPE